ncbi:MAG: Rrf2 family transcriptional regulator [Eubacteriales bacterium]|nr:Rrf2 family transcriptional regulator [Eubacteriales bacterium]
MNVTSKGRYALRVMIDLAQHSGDGFISLKTIADRQGISMKYLEMIVGSLKKANLLDSTRGKEGGYMLSRPSGDYSVREILHSIEDNLAPVACIKAGSVQCEHAAECMTVPMWKELDELTNAYLDGITLDDLISGRKWKQPEAFD